MLQQSITLLATSSQKITLESTQTRKIFPIFHRVTCRSNNVICLTECVMHKIQYVRKIETSFNIRLNNYCKVNVIKAFKRFNNNEHIFRKHGKFIIIEQLRNISTTPNETLKLKLRER